MISLSDVSVASDADIASRIAPIQKDLERFAESFSTGKIIHRGLTLAIVGRPNVGKSSLFNCLLQQERAIVTNTPGTTRDLVAETIEIEGVPLRFVDTAGIREAFDEAGLSESANRMRPPKRATLRWWY